MDSVASLEQFPERHQVVTDRYLSGHGIRFLPVANYILIYAIRNESKQVVIHRFLHGSQDWLTILKKDYGA